MEELTSQAPRASTEGRLQRIERLLETLIEAIQGEMRPGGAPGIRQRQDAQAAEIAELRGRVTGLEAGRSWLRDKGASIIVSALSAIASGWAVMHTLGSQP